MVIRPLFAMDTNSQNTNRHTIHHSTASDTTTPRSTFDADGPQIGVFHHKPSKPGKGKFNPKRLVSWFKHLSKKQKILVIVLAILVLLGAVGLGYFIFRDTSQPAVVEQSVVEEKAPTTVPSELTGLPVKPEVNSKQVTAVMVENSPDARPQSGLTDAGVVFEAIAEAGITRFMALYQDTESDYIGPVRSARPYYLDFLMPFDAAYGHVGGSPEALRLIRQRGVKDLDQFGAPGSYERVSSRYAPHNVYTSTGKLNALEKERGYNKSNFTGFARKTDESPASTPKVKKIDLNISSVLYNVHYDYHKKSNSYRRVMGGKAHTDEKSGKQISPKVVVAVVMNKGLASDGYHTTYGTTGKGRVFVFQDGKVIKGTWQKKSAKKQFVFKDNAGQEIQLTPGKTWVTIVSDANQVSYKP